MRMKEMFKVFPEGCIITGDDMRIPRGRGKPLPDIYLLALKTVNESWSMARERYRQRSVWSSRIVCQALRREEGRE